MTTGSRGLGRRVGALALAAVALTGCSTRGFTRELVVQFAPDTPDSQKDAVRAGCSAIRGVSAEPPQRESAASRHRDDVRFDITHASDAQIAELYRCINHRPGVVGASEPDPTT